MSPTYSQSKGKSESAVKMVKAVLKKALEDDKIDPQLAFLYYRNSPIAGMKFSPAEIFNRRLRDGLPRSEESLKSLAIDPTRDIEMAQERQKYYYDRTARHRPDFKPGDPVLFRRGNNW